MTTSTGSAPITRGMELVNGGTFLMGSDGFYPEEQPVHPVTVDGFRIDRHPVTVAAFRRFVKDTGYRTVAERTPHGADYPGADPQELVPGALVFHRTAGPVDLDDWRQWWSYVPGADWRHPAGPASTRHGQELHPVTQIAYEDALTFAQWAGKDLPTEAEWEYAARGGLDRATFAWGQDFTPKGRRMATTWHGRFPWEHLPAGRHDTGPGTTPVGTYPPNGYGLYDMTGNVWEWTRDHYTDRHPHPAPGTCCAPRNPAADPPRPQDGTAAERFPRRVIKGGSYLCAPNYCLRYRPAARQSQSEDTATCHLGFRCVLR
ncbi:formylglycine-generating enzyme family protein [Kitasatospora sp. NPDC048239]|uniref:formylglycine-generating enzyme family protein n=1 Tax=Kitasatospora sp. NPDC048239 TaxID=3364046 RepID=UPI00371CA137